jgi:branched-chain amino acid transport system ATP-binding protein
MSEPVSDRLTVSGLDAWYGTAHVLFGLDLTVEGGRTLAVLGRNGAGKTTLLRSIARGMVTTTGEVRHGSHRLDRMRPDQAARSGVQLVPEDRRILTSLSVEENLLLGHRACGG